jgi:hypothetical protein
MWYLGVPIAVDVMCTFSSKIEPVLVPANHLPIPVGPHGCGARRRLHRRH